MKKIISLFAVIAITVLSAAATFAAEPELGAEELIREAFQNFSTNVDTVKMNMDMTVSIRPPAEFEDEAIDFDIALSGAVDSTDVENPRLSLLIDLAADIAEIGPQVAKGEIRMENELVYVMLSEISDFGGEVPTAMTDPYIGQWWIIPIPEGALTDFGTLTPADLAAQEEKVNEIIGRTDFFKDLEYIGSEKVSGVDTWHYSGNLNNDGIISFIYEVYTEFEDSTPTEAEVAELEEALEMLDFAVDVWIGQDDIILRRVLGTANVVIPENEGGGEVDMEFDLTYSALNEPVDIEIPEDATEIDLSALTEDLSPRVPFPDVAGQEYEEAIEFVYLRGVVDGYPDGTYKPDKQINRAEFTKIIVEAVYPGQATGSNCFPDVKEEWFAPYVCFAAEKGIIDGYPDGTFRPADYVNYVESLKIIMEAFGFEAVEDGAAWYAPYLEEAKAWGIHIQGSENAELISRGKMAELIMRTTAGN